MPRPHEKPWPSKHRITTCATSKLAVDPFKNLRNLKTLCGHFAEHVVNDRELSSLIDRATLATRRLRKGRSESKRRRRRRLLTSVCLRRPRLDFICRRATTRCCDAVTSCARPAPGGEDRRRDGVTERTGIFYSGLRIFNFSHGGPARLLIKPMKWPSQTKTRIILCSVNSSTSSP